MASRRRSAAVRISAGGEEGSGFVASVEGRLIVTARHCVKRVADGTPDAVALYFLDPSTWGLATPRTADRTGTVMARGRGPDDDWAVVRVTGGLPAWVEVLPLCDLAMDEGDVWASAGYPPDALARDIGDDFGGKVVNAGALIKLDDPSAKARRVSGISGAACVIEGRVLGVIARADEQAGVSTTGMFYAIPFSRVARDMPAEVRFERDPPFLELATSYLEGGIGLRDIVERLLRESAAEVQRLARFVARLVLMRDVALAAEVAIRAVSPRRGSDACDLVDVTAAQWFPVDGAASLARQLTVPLPGPRAAAVNIECPELAMLYVRRAGFELNGATSWHKGRIDVSWIPGISEDDDLVGEVTRHLYLRLLGKRLDPADDWRSHVAEVNLELGRWYDPPRDRWRMQFVMLPIGATRTAIEHLATAYPALAILMRTGGDDIITADAPIVEPVLPKPVHLDDWRSAGRQIRDHFKEKS